MHRPLLSPLPQSVPINANALVDAIFISTRGRPHYLSRCFSANHTEGPVIVLATNSADHAGIQLASNIEVIYLQQGLRQETIDSRFASFMVDDWDLYRKRNHALAVSRQRGYKKILLLDDDIRELTEELATTGAWLLNRYSIAGCFPDEYPDTSVFGHAENLTGDRQEAFLSGSCLFVDVERHESFFPPIYNEDWLFMVPAIQRHSIVGFGSVAQEAYTPFDVPDRARFQEFGEIFAEGVFAVLHVKISTEALRHLNFWEERLMRRRREFEVVVERLAELNSEAAKDALAALAAAKEFCCSLTSNRLQHFANLWLDELASLSIERCSLK